MTKSGLALLEGQNGAARPVTHRQHDRCGKHSRCKALHVRRHLAVHNRNFMGVRPHVGQKHGEQEADLLPSCSFAPQFIICHYLT